MGDFHNNASRRALLKRTGAVGAFGLAGSSLADSVEASSTDAEWIDSYSDSVYEEEQITGSKYRLEHSLSVSLIGSSYDDQEEKYQHKYAITSLLASRFNDGSNSEGYIKAGTNNGLQNHELKIGVNTSDLELWTSSEPENIGVYPNSSSDEVIYGIETDTVEEVFAAATSEINPVIGFAWTVNGILQTLAPEKQDEWSTQEQISGTYDPGDAFDSFLYLEALFYTDDPCERDPFYISSAGNRHRELEDEGTSHDVTVYTPQVSSNLC